VNYDELPYLIQRMQVQDIPEVMEIERACFSMPWSARAYRYEIEENPLSDYFSVRAARPGRRSSLWDRFLGALPAAEPRSPVIGYGGFWMMVDEAHISTLAVAPMVRRRGLGELLLLRMVDEAENRGAACVTLEVRVSNLAAQKLYEKYGFETQGRRIRYYSDNGEDAFIMTTPPLASPAYRETLAVLEDRLFARLTSQGEE
jgi:ribosomal-protein-alanine N-acetyltransferase